MLVVEPPELGVLPTLPAEDEAEGEAEAEGEPEAEEASLSGSPESVLVESWLSSGDLEELAPGVGASLMMPGCVVDTTTRITTAGTTTRLETNIHLLLVQAFSSEQKEGMDFI